jgi:cytochrome c
VIRSLAAVLTLAVVATFATPQLVSAQNAADGEAVFKKCRACHQVGPTAKNGVGPQQNGVVGRAAGTIEGFAYSDINKAAGAAGLVWTEEAIVEYLADPQAYLVKFLTSKGKADQATGNTKMSFKLPNEQDRKDVVAYLKTVK